MPSTPSSTVTPEPTVSIIIVTWNQRLLLEASLQSLESPQGTDFEVVVVDNGSTDDTPVFLTSFARVAPYPLRIVTSSTNRGFCGGNNLGFEAARGAYFALLNNDAEAQPYWISHLLSAFREPDVGMAACKIVTWEDPTVIDKVGHLIWLDGQNRGRGTGEKDTGQYDAIEEVLWPDGCACMYRRSMIAQIGGFDEEFFAYADDAELGLRARIAGWRCLYIPRAVVRHHRGSSLGRHSAQRITLIERNRVLLAAKLFPGRLLWKNGAYYLARLWAGAQAALRNRGEIGRISGTRGKMQAALALLKGDLSAVPMLPSMLRKRRRLNRIRKLTPRQVEQLLRQHQIPLSQLSEQA